MTAADAVDKRNECVEVYSLLKCQKPVAVFRAAVDELCCRVLAKLEKNLWPQTCRMQAAPRIITTSCRHARPIAMRSEPPVCSVTTVPLLLGLEVGAAAVSGALSNDLLFKRFIESLLTTSHALH
jgi:hypothetical protein